MVSIRNVDLDRLNSATKYPQILTYHAMKNKTGRLTDSVNMEFSGAVQVTEKVDGANGRIVFCPGGGFVIGSRSEFLTGEGDLIANPAEDIVKALEGPASRIDMTGSDIAVAYLEVYGSKGAAARQYGNGNTVSCRLFDVAFIPVNALDGSRSKISGWRDRGGQSFADTSELPEWAARLGVGTVPLIMETDAIRLPMGLTDTEDWLRGVIPHTKVALDDTARGRPEGVVIRSHDRSRIAKMRFEDYARTRRGGSRG